MVIDFNHPFNSHLREFSIRARSVLDKIVFWKESSWIGYVIYISFSELE